jgi:trans-2,3-dihydro-3-hydroxyanthranilate isomerase
MMTSMSAWAYTVCDVFTDAPLAGNPLAVFTEASDIPDAVLGQLAREMNLSETVYVYPAQSGVDARIRIFTPAKELPFAGHPVLGTAAVLGLARNLDEVRLQTGVGVVPVMLQTKGARHAFGWMRQPIPTFSPFGDPAALLQILGVTRSVLPIEVYNNGVQHAYVALENEDAVGRLTPNFGALARLVPQIGVNCFAGRGRRWKTRMFGPGLGVAEDPATGSAAGPLAVHLLRHSLIAPVEQIEISQGAEIGRPSQLYARVTGAPEEIQQVEVGGSTVVVARGEFALGGKGSPRV